MKYPILEFEEEEVAKIEPSALAREKLPSNKLVITFFGEVVEELWLQEKIEMIRIIGGENPLNVYKFVDSDVLLIHGKVGCPACGGDLELLHAYGINKVMFCGGGGVLDKDISVGKILVVDGAIRDEGFSYHYIKPSRYIYTDKETTNKIANYLETQKIEYIRGLTWTTDAIFRETEQRIKKRKEEGAKMVEMEQAGCIAVSQFRGFKYGALIYGGDDVSGDEWDRRGWRSIKEVRRGLVLICKEIVQAI